jgi:hypothetical protein
MKANRHILWRNADAVAFQQMSNSGQSMAVQVRSLFPPLWNVDTVQISEESLLAQNAPETRLSFAAKREAVG